jgi:hypothetical protein
MELVLKLHNCRQLIRSLLTAAFRVHFQVTACYILGGRRDTRASYSQFFIFSSTIYHSTLAPYPSEVCGKSDQATG